MAALLEVMRSLSLCRACHGPLLFSSILAVSNTIPLLCCRSYSLFGQYCLLFTRSFYSTSATLAGRGGEHCVTPIPLPPPADPSPTLHHGSLIRIGKAHADAGVRKKKRNKTYIRPCI